MAFLLPKKPLRSPSSRYDDDEERRQASAQSSVTSCIYLKPGAGGAAAVRQSLDKEVVLRRIRQRKRANQIHTAIECLLGALPEPGEKDGDPPSCWQIDDAFSAP